MARKVIDLDLDVAEAVRQRYGLPTLSDAVDYALRLADRQPLDLEAARTLRGSGWDGDLDEMRQGRIL